MSATQKTDTVSFTVKGQVVIPRWLRKDFEINEGTRAVVYKHNDHIVLKPLTAQHYRRLRGSLKGTKAMSYADCFAAALAKTRNAELVTGDREFKVVESELKSIRWLK